MKIFCENTIVNKGIFSKSETYAQIITELHEAIKCVSWNDEFKFIINPIKKGNGVFPIKNQFIKYLNEKEWVSEVRISLASGMNPGPIDAVKINIQLPFAVEWETGNISSSHRALNKIAIGIIQGKICGGALILPTRSFGKYLTDRVGNYEELQPYFDLYKHLKIRDGVICVIGIEHDDINLDAPLIPKGKDGNSKDKPVIII